MLTFRLFPSNTSSTGPFSQLDSPSIFGCILQTVWRAHWHTAIDQIPFEITTILQSIQKTLHRLNAEETLLQSYDPLI